MKKIACLGLLWGLLSVVPNNATAENIDLSKAVIVYRTHASGNAEKNAPEVLSKEMEKRTGIKLTTSSQWQAAQPSIVLTSQVKSAWNKTIPYRNGSLYEENKAEGYRLFVEQKQGEAPVVWVIGNDSRGVLFGVGELIRRMDWSQGKITLDNQTDVATAPQYYIRGHQIGYRNTANSWDAWTKEQFEQYLLDMALFGSNSMENIPFHDQKSPVFKYSRDEMNVFFSEVCDKYELDHWDWVPLDFELKDKTLFDKALKEYEQYFASQKRLDALFFPGGDPGDNHPEWVFKFMEECYKVGRKKFPNLQIWVSLQGYNKEREQWVYDYLNKYQPKWLTGIANGPGSPNIEREYNNIPRQYKFRTYPDLTHNKLCQYQVPWWDQAYALTQGREATNPRPEQYAYIHNWFAPFTDGILSYSDGVHDDVNKITFSTLAWNPRTSARDVCVEYARLYFCSEVGEEAGDAILALENNWRGTLSNNGAVNGTLLMWQKIEKEHPELLKNWRFQQLLMRAYYDKYVRDKYIRETDLENRANAAMLTAGNTGSAKAIENALAILNKADNYTSPQLRSRVIDLCEDLWQSIQLQTSVSKYQASGAERGAVLDFIDVPLNNRWWLEDEFKKVNQMKTEKEKVTRLKEIALWENPGTGSFYDDIGNRHKSDHVLHADFTYTQPGETYQPEPLYWWKDEGRCRDRQSWQITMDYPKAVVYEALDRNGQYIIRMTGRGKFLLKINGERVEPLNPGVKQTGEVIEFAVDKRFLKEQKLTLTWDKPTDEGHLNWREQSRLSEVWLIKKP